MRSLALALSFLLVASQPARADTFWEKAGDYAEKYGVPCLVGLAAAYAVDRADGPVVGVGACAVVFTYGEFSQGSRQTVTKEDLRLVQEMIDKNVAASSQKIREDEALKFEQLDRRILDDSILSRQSVRNAVTDLGAFLEKDLSEKVDRRMESPRILKEIDLKIDERVKEEVQGEYRSKEREIVEKASEKVIKRVTAEPILVDERPKAAK
jgi:hypothetical protein